MFCLKQDNFLSATNESISLIPCLYQDKFLQNATKGSRSWTPRIFSHLNIQPSKYFSHLFLKCWNFNIALLYSFQVLHESWSTLFNFLMQFWENGQWKRSQCSHSVGGSAIHFRNGKSMIQWQLCGEDFI